MLLASVVGGLGFEFCMFVAGWRHALRSEWPFIIIIITIFRSGKNLLSVVVQHRQQPQTIHLSIWSPYRREAKARPGGMPWARPAAQPHSKVGMPLTHAPTHQGTWVTWSHDNVLNCERVFFTDVSFQTGHLQHTSSHAMHGKISW